MSIVRWAFDIRQPLLLENIEPLVTSLTDNSKPHIVPATNLLNFLPKIESDRLLQFRFEDDMRRSLIGRLMIHAFFAAYHGCSWDKLVFSRSPSGKPILVEPEHLRDVCFNVSHHGEWVVLAGNTSLERNVQCGIDVMDFKEQVPGEPFESVISIFLDQFTSNELAWMRKVPADPAPPPSIRYHLKKFYRLWCLKEAIVKALGVGMSDGTFKTFEFTIDQEEETLTPILSTEIVVHVPSEELPRDVWTIEEALLDEEHCYAVAVHTESTNNSLLDGSLIIRLDWKELLKDAVPYPNYPNM
ncbi:hypothetical protein BGZ76_006941 [Entomortierella beljakovae]|nr:hypothetical protein BGZ76_006941 [Entomortierella beljakovae]